MKKLSILVAAVLISTTAFAQGSIDNQFYFRFGYSLPSWKQYGGTQSDWQDDGYKRKGFMGEVGSIFMLNSIPMPNGMAIGINADYLSVYWHQFIRYENYYYSTLRFDSKVGPSFTYSPVDNFAFDVYVKADISLAASSSFHQDIKGVDSKSGFFAIGLSTGLNIRYSIVMIGFEFNTINAKLDNRSNPGYYRGNFRDYNDTGDKSKLPSFTFSLGISF